MPFHDSGKPAGASLARKVPAIRPAQKTGAGRRQGSNFAGAETAMKFVRSLGPSYRNPLNDVQPLRHFDKGSAGVSLSHGPDQN
jgi:hypothetical protein